MARTLAGGASPPVGVPGGEQRVGSESARGTRSLVHAATLPARTTSSAVKSMKPGRIMKSLQQKINLCQFRYLY